MKIQDFIIKNKLQRFVQFLDKIDDSKLREIYASSNLVLFPALDQTWGLTPIEALCCNKLSIVSNDSGVSEVLRKQECGIVCKPTPEEFSQNILEFYKNQQKYKKMIVRGNEYVENNLTWRHYAKRMKSNFEKSLNSTK